MNIKNIFLCVLLAGACMQSVSAMKRSGSKGLEDYALEALDGDGWVEVCIIGLCRYTKLINSGNSEYFERAKKLAKLAYRSDNMLIRTRALSLYRALVIQNQAIDAAIGIVEQWLFALQDYEMAHQYQSLYLELASNVRAAKKLEKLANRASQKDGPLFRQEEAGKIYRALKERGLVEGSSSETIESSLSRSGELTLGDALSGYSVAIDYTEASDCVEAIEYY